MFLRDDGETFGIGISGDYDGAVQKNQWQRIAFSIKDEGNGGARLAKFVNGILVGEQTVEVSRFAVNAENGILILTDNDFETFDGRMGLFAWVSRALSDDEIVKLGEATPGPLFELDTSGVVEFNFEPNSFLNGKATATTGDARLSIRTFQETFELDAGVVFLPYDPDGGWRLISGINSVVNSFSFFYDILLDEIQRGAFGSLLQLDGDNSSDGELFLRRNDDGTYGVGISGQYDGIMLAGQWYRVAITILAEGNGSSRLKKFIDGKLVGEQVVDSSRFRVDPDLGILLFGDNDDETFSGRLATIAAAAFALSDEQVLALRGPGPGGILINLDIFSVVEFNLDTVPFRNGQAPATFGEGALIDRTFAVALQPESGTPFTASGLEGGFLLATKFGPALTSYSLLFDVWIPSSQQSKFGSLVQTDLTQSSDGELFLRSNDDGTYSIGISGVYGTLYLESRGCCVAKLDYSG